MYEFPLLFIRRFKSQSKRNRLFEKRQNWVHPPQLWILGGKGKKTHMNSLGRKENFRWAVGVTGETGSLTRKTLAGGKKKAIGAWKGKLVCQKMTFKAVRNCL